MAKVTRYANSVPDGTQPAAQQSSAYKMGRVRTHVGSVQIAATDSIDSSYVLASGLPSDCLLLPSSTLYWDGDTAVDDADLGDWENLTALLETEDIDTAGSTPLDKPATEDWIKPLWQVLGYTADPRKPLDIVLTIRAAATTAGHVTLVLHYVID